MSIVSNAHQRLSFVLVTIVYCGMPGMYVVHSAVDLQIEIYFKEDTMLVDLHIEVYFKVDRIMPCVQTVHALLVLRPAIVFD